MYGEWEVYQQELFMGIYRLTWDAGPDPDVILLVSAVDSRFEQCRWI
ncbi:hypothetical protein ACFSCZ_17195 [Siminovitchia sediminis]|uniref:Uncharacterized protein n=1 Tax=Siminovitchia sediminis TaxID=1274353 RepID=A0ABW4KK82_9BACI